MTKTLAETITILDNLRHYDVGMERKEKDALAIAVAILGRVEQGREKAEKVRTPEFAPRLPDDGQWDDIYLDDDVS